MRYTRTLLIFLLPVFSMAQSSKVRTDSVFIQELLDTWSLGLKEDGDEPADIRVFNKYKSLFRPEALVEDDINAAYNPQSYKDPFPYKTSIKPVEIYAHDMVLEFKNLKIDSVMILSDVAVSDTVRKITIARSISGEKRSNYIIGDLDSLVNNIIRYKTGQYHIAEVDTADFKKAIQTTILNRENLSYMFSLRDTLLITLSTNSAAINKWNSVKIRSMLRDPSLKMKNIRCKNDDDQDGIVNGEDKCPDEPGDFTALGCIDNDLDGTGDAVDKCPFIYGVSENSGCPKDYFLSAFNFSVWGGAQVNSAKMNLPELDKLGYNSLDFNQSSKGALKSPGLIISPIVGTDFAYFFGKKKKRAGISLGISYTGFAATYEVTDAAVYTFKSNDGQDDYRRRITLNNGSREEIDYTILNLPVLFKYRDFFGKGNPDRKLYKWNWEFSAGPSFIMFNNTAKYNSNIDFEGMYQVDTINQDAVTYYDYFDNASTWNVLLTADDINQQDSIPGAGAVFGLLNDHGYDFAFGKNYTGQDKKASRSSIAFNGRFDVCHRFDEKGNVAIKFGASICAAPLPDQSSGYELIDKTSDPYNSIYNSNAKSVYFSYGLNAGIILRW